MCLKTIDNVTIGKKFLDYAISRAKVNLMRNSMVKVRANSSTFDSIKVKNTKKYNLRGYGI